MLSTSDSDSDSEDFIAMTCKHVWNLFWYSGVYNRTDKTGQDIANVNK